MLITPHFSVTEFACRNGVPYPEKWIEPRLRPLCNVLEMVRATFDRPIVVLSGYRTLVHNFRVRGKLLSQHLFGRAADIQIEGISPTEVYTTVLRLAKAGLGIGGLGRYQSFTHIDIRPRKADGRLAIWTGERLAADVV